MKVAGEILSTKKVFNDFGMAWKMLVKTDGGYKVWSTIPRELYQYRGFEQLEAGKRIEFMATIEPSKDDPKFGFASRPSVLKKAA
jgi:hypothetical protein